MSNYGRTLDRKIGRMSLDENGQVPQFPQVVPKGPIALPEDLRCRIYEMVREGYFPDTVTALRRGLDLIKAIDRERPLYLAEYVGNTFWAVAGIPQEEDK